MAAPWCWKMRRHLKPGAHSGAMAVIRLPLPRRRNRRNKIKKRYEEKMGDILIVDDERDIRELISDILEDEGFTTRGWRVIPTIAMAVRDARNRRR